MICRLVCWYRCKCQKVTGGSQLWADQWHVTVTGDTSHASGHASHTDSLSERGSSFSPHEDTLHSCLLTCFFFSFHLRCSLPFLSSLAFSPAPPSAVAHAHPRPPSLHTCTLSLRPVHIPQVTGSAESGVIPPLRSCHLPQLLSGMLRVKHGSCTFLFLAISTHAFVCISAWVSVCEGGRVTLRDGL